MILTLRAVSLNDQPLTRPITARFDAGGGTIGRADHSTMALPDPERFISRKQAEVVFVNGGFLVRNVGAANPILLGQRTLAGGESAVIDDGEEVRIGGYLLLAEFSTAARALPAELPTFSRLPAASAGVAIAASSWPATPAHAMPAPPAPSRPAPAGLASGNPFADLLGSGDDLAAAGGAADPFADLRAGPPAAPPPTAPRSGNAFDGLMPPPAGIDSRSAAVAPAAPAPIRLPDDFDPFALPAAPRVAVPAAFADPFAGLVSAQAAPGIDQQFGLPGVGSGAAGADPLRDFELGLGGPGATGRGELPATDPLAMFAPAPRPAAQPAPAAVPMADNVHGVFAAFEPPAVVGPAAPARPQPARAVAGDAALWAAFCEGAGIALPLPADAAQVAARLRQAGQVLRAAVEGTRELMAVRASTKYEMRAAVTQIHAHGNNPLKFAPDARVGIEQLVQPAVGGFLDGPAAMDDAMRDLVGHSIGAVAGMRAAIEGLLDRFDPAILEGRLGGSMLDSLLPQNRKARLWELYLQRYRALRDDAHDDFDALFGKAFLAAYEQQVARLKQPPSGGGRGS